MTQRITPQCGRPAAVPFAAAFAVGLAVTLGDEGVQSVVMKVALGQPSGKLQGGRR